MTCEKCGGTRRVHYDNDDIDPETQAVPSFPCPACSDSGERVECEHADALGACTDPTKCPPGVRRDDECDGTVPAGRGEVE